MKQADLPPVSRTLTVCCRWGLANRLRALLSGMALAEATGRRFTMLWPRTADCSATFGELFTNDLNVIEQDLPPGTPILGLYLGGRAWEDFTKSADEHLVVLTPSWIHRPDLYPAHKAIKQRCIELLDTLQPIPYVQQSVQSFRSTRFRTTMIGVHLRRGDFSEAETRDNTRHAMAQVNAFLEKSPQVGIFLCTDDGAVHQYTGRQTQTEGVKNLFRKTYADRVVWTEPRSLDRRCPEALQDALIDLYLLTATDYVIGTGRSSFSMLGYFGRSVPAVMCVSLGARYRARKLFYVATGVYPLLKLIGYIQYRRNVPFSQLARHYRWRLMAGLRRLRSFVSRTGRGRQER